jgi:hemerythrin-like domain-containing protein
MDGFAYKEDVMNEAIRILRDEHRSMSAVLHGLQELARTARNPLVRPDFSVLRAMIYYIDAFPERLHHPKENEVLFPRVLARSPAAAALVQELRGEHEKGATLIGELERALIAFEVAWPFGADGFAEAVRVYANFHWDHMRKEEQALLPLAEAALHEEDWKAIAAAFERNEDPIADLREKDFAELFSRIVAIAPAPVGLGRPWKRAAG